MRPLMFFVGWCILFVLCWPLALLALFLAPIIWIISIPFRIVGITFHAVFALLREVLLLPVRILRLLTTGSMRRTT
ncbi:MAG TPA: hypothetical protein VFH33_02295 [Candidatus Krumholzibacteria bacterium]|nr:hypothetical protein [Candidatus Krumholzibacteria bacterium]